jgi:DNA-binding MarR family transcriptional regulator
MIKHATQNSPRQKARTLPVPQQPESIDARTASEAIFKVADVARTLKCATHVMERVVHLATGENEHLTLLHWLVLVRLSSTPTCKQMDLKSDTKIAAAYLTRLLDDLTRKGLVRRHRSSTDRRQILLALTVQGKAAALELLTALNVVIQPSQLATIEHLRLSLEQFVSLAAGEGWLGTEA